MQRYNFLFIYGWFLRISQSRVNCQQNHSQEYYNLINPKLGSSYL